MKFSNIILLLALLLISGSVCSQTKTDNQDIVKLVSPTMMLSRFLEPTYREFTKGTPVDKERALLRVKLIVDAYFSNVDYSAQKKADQGKSVKSSFHSDFFSQGYFFGAIKTMKDAGVLDNDLLKKSRIMAEESLTIPLYAERGPNNRAFYYALANAYASQLFLESKDAKKWIKYANDVWNDWYEAGDSYEPGYVSHNIRRVIELGLALGKETELKSEKIRKTFYRYRDHISSTGLTMMPGDGLYQPEYLDALIEMTEVTADPTLYWAADQAFWAGDYWLYRGKRRNRNSKEDIKVYNQEFAKICKMGIKPKIPATACMVQDLYPTTYKVKDRVYMTPGRQPGKPFVGYYILDCGETTHHTHEDNRGDLLHYEVDSIMYLGHTGWSKWVGFANTFVVEDAMNEFPAYSTQGMIQDYWYKGSTNMRILRHFQESENYVFQPSSKVGHDKLFVSTKSKDLGFFYVNPEGFSGKCDKVHIDNISFRINSFPRRTDTRVTAQMAGSYNPGMEWVRDSREFAPCDDAKTIVIDNVSICGPAGKNILFDFEKGLPEIEIKVYPVGSLLDSTLIKTIKGNDVYKIVSLVDSKLGNGKALQVRSDLGRTDIYFKNINIDVDFNKDYNRIDFDYCYKSDVSEFLRPSLKVAVNDQAPRSMYIDRQQGGILKDAKTDQKNEDCYSSFSYNGVFTFDSNWTRKTVLTKEGYLIVVDEYIPGKTADGMVGGPVWQMLTPPQAGLHWFDATVINHPDKKLLIYFHPDRLNRYGEQVQYKYQKDNNYAVYAQSRLKANVPARFITVMVPHDASKDGIEISGKTNFAGFMDFPTKSKKGVFTSLDIEGNASISIKEENKERKIESVDITMNEDGSWDVKR